MSNLRDCEYKFLVAKATEEGKILIVEPMDSATKPSIRFYYDEKLKSLRQYLGQFDTLGYVNSTLNQNHIKIKNAQHHLNTQWPMYMNLTHILEGVIRKE